MAWVEGSSKDSVGSLGKQKWGAIIRLKNQGEGVVTGVGREGKMERATREELLSSFKGHS